MSGCFENFGNDANRERELNDFLDSESEGLCPECGCNLDSSGECVECGWKAVDNDRDTDGELPWIYD